VRVVEHVLEALAVPMVGPLGVSQRISTVFGFVGSPHLEGPVTLYVTLKA
jgi:hypothetical protein